MRKSIETLSQAARASAEQWVIECPRCAHSAPALERGIIRIAASSKGKRTLARCTNCNKLTLARLTKDPQRAHDLRARQPSISPSQSS